MDEEELKRIKHRQSVRDSQRRKAERDPGWIDEERERKRLLARRLRVEFPERERTNKRRYYATDKGKSQSRNEKQRYASRKFGWALPGTLITPEVLSQMYEDQQGCCALCQHSFPELAQITGRRVCVDHDHETGEVRALICNACNLHLGWFEKHYTEAVNYLNNYGSGGYNH